MVKALSFIVYPVASKKPQNNLDWSAILEDYLPSSIK
jgi:hypothetical protein